MGCSNSNDKKDKSDDEQKAERFKRRVSNNEPLARALRRHFDEFMRSCEDLSGGRSNRVEYDKEVKVNHNAEEANKQKLTYETAKETASDFLGYAMVDLGEKNWGGNVHSQLRGAEGRTSSLKLTGKVEFDTLDRTVEEPYHVEFKFFCAREEK